MHTEYKKAEDCIDGLGLTHVTGTTSCPVAGTPLAGDRCRTLLGRNHPPPWYQIPPPPGQPTLSSNRIIITEVSVIDWRENICDWSNHIHKVKELRQFRHVCASCLKAKGLKSG